MMHTAICAALIVGACSLLLLHPHQADGMAMEGMQWQAANAHQASSFGRQNERSDRISIGNLVHPSNVNNQQEAKREAWKHLRKMEEERQAMHGGAALTGMKRTAQIDGTDQRKKTRMVDRHGTLPAQSTSQPHSDQEARIKIYVKADKTKTVRLSKGSKYIDIDRAWPSSPYTVYEELGRQQYYIKCHVHDKSYRHEMAFYDYFDTLRGRGAALAAKLDDILFKRIDSDQLANGFGCILFSSPHKYARLSSALDGARTLKRVKQQSFFATKIVTSLALLEEHNIAYGYTLPSHIWVTAASSKDPLNIKLADFERARVFDNNAPPIINGMGGSPSKAIMHMRDVSAAIDVFDLATSEVQKQIADNDAAKTIRTLTTIASSLGPSTANLIEKVEEVQRSYHQQRKLLIDILSLMRHTPSLRQVTQKPKFQELLATFGADRSKLLA
ncbi:hypothetical protein SYNPS1DRAFT_30401 [Syncephalis pseudoplumigaleata]|uniref:Protein kinase domain-containing protein n=1 Tax=Syncephalis pseudoplumigaleata TaxID=1712513 RepID=A0A4P9YV11_9FUNG|nr:hypothetical protein SYNPS1DRAFT_30401 [Syncephalis pseudoplumigaleata]|eukprot:RKP23836.1 hypothetical protein SYNPS1DRAFT_30401 [Syncephalis pseudoplumigaleata]